MTLGLDRDVGSFCSICGSGSVGTLLPGPIRRGAQRGLETLARRSLSSLVDLLRRRVWEVSDFSVDVPRESIAHVIRETNDLLAVGLSTTSSDNLPALADSCAAAPTVDPDVLVVVRGHEELRAWRPTTRGGIVGEGESSPWGMVAPKVITLDGRGP